MTKELALRLPDDIFEVIKKFKEVTGVSYTNFIYNAVVWFALSRGLIDLSYLRLNGKKKAQIIPETTYGIVPPSEIMYCSTDKCEIDMFTNNVNKIIEEITEGKEND